MNFRRRDKMSHLGQTRNLGRANPNPRGGHRCPLVFCKFAGNSLACEASNKCFRDFFVVSGRKTPPSQVGFYPAIPVAFGELIRLLCARGLRFFRDSASIACRSPVAPLRRRGRRENPAATGRALTPEPKGVPNAGRGRCDFTSRGSVSIFVEIIPALSAASAVAPCRLFPRYRRVAGPGLALPSSCSR